VKFRSANVRRHFRRGSGAGQAPARYGVRCNQLITDCCTRIVHCLTIYVNYYTT